MEWEIQRNEDCISRSIKGLLYSHLPPGWWVDEQEQLEKRDVPTTNQGPPGPKVCHSYCQTLYPVYLTHCVTVHVIYKPVNNMDLIISPWSTIYMSSRGPQTADRYPSRPVFQPSFQPTQQLNHQDWTSTASTWEWYR